MALAGDLFYPDTTAPVSGVYQCSYPRCMAAFAAIAPGVRLPPAHHLGAAWELIRVLPSSDARSAAASFGVRCFSTAFDR